ncbi:MAG: F-box protein [Parachlamydiales bacterium]|nr:F-box protein [Parachlamydiales bacterium]
MSSSAIAFDLISNLPHDIKNEVATYLKPEESLLCREVSKIWKGLFSDAVLWNTLSKQCSFINIHNKFLINLGVYQTNKKRLENNVSTLTFSEKVFYADNNCTLQGMTVWNNKIVMEKRSEDKYEYFVFDGEIPSKYSYVKNYNGNQNTSCPVIEETINKYLDRVIHYSCFTVLKGKLIGADGCGNILELKENGSRTLLYYLNSNITHLDTFQDSLVVLALAKENIPQLSLLNLSDKVAKTINIDTQKILTYKNMILCVEGIRLKIFNENLELVINRQIAQEKLKDIVIYDNFIYISRDYGILNLVNFDDFYNSHAHAIDFKTNSTHSSNLKTICNQVVVFHDNLPQSTIQVLDAKNPHSILNKSCYRLISDNILLNGSKIFRIFRNVITVLDFAPNNV